MEANTSEGSVVKFIVEKTADKIIRKNGNEEEDLGDVYTPEKAAKLLLKLYKLLWKALQNAVLLKHHH